MIQVTNTNPIAPATMPDIDDIMNAYHQQAAMIRGEQQQQQEGINTFNPFAPQQQENQQDAQQAHAAAMQQAYAPIAHNEYDINSTHNEKRQQAFESRVEQDPAFKEFAPGMIQVAETLRQGVMAGKIDMNTALSMGQSWLNDNAKPVFKKHHSDSKWFKENE